MDLSLLYWAATVYVSFKVTHFLIALLRAVFIYRIAPLFYQPNLDRYKSQWTLVTGGTEGIGRAYSIQLAQRGLSKFIFIGHIQANLDEVKKYFEETFNAEVCTYLFDFSTGDFDVLQKYIEGFHIGFVVHSAGVGREKMERFGDNRKADEYILRVNGFAAGLFLAVIMKAMERTGGGQVVVLAATLCYFPTPNLSAYCAAKMIPFTLCEPLLYEYPTVNVQCLTPGVVATRMTYYEKPCGFVIMPEQMASEAVRTIGLTSCCAGSFIHEFQISLRHLLPWFFVRWAVRMIVLYQKKRVERLLEERSKKK